MLLSNCLLGDMDEECVLCSMGYFLFNRLCYVENNSNNNDQTNNQTNN